MRYAHKLPINVGDIVVIPNGRAGNWPYHRIVSWCPNRAATVMDSRGRVQNVSWTLMLECLRKPFETR